GLNLKQSPELPSSALLVFSFQIARKKVRALGPSKVRVRHRRRPGNQRRHAAWPGRIAYTDRPQKSQFLGLPDIEAATGPASWTEAHRALANSNASQCRSR